MNTSNEYHEERTFIDDNSLRISYQLQAARVLAHHPLLSSYFALQAVDSETSPCNINLQSDVSNNSSSAADYHEIEGATNERILNKKIIDCKYEELENDLICPTCGLHLSAGHFNTSIRLRRLNRGSTRRRRSSRYYSQFPDASHLKQGSIIPNARIISPKQRRNPSKNSKDHDELERCITQKKYFQTLKRVTDGQARACVVYECGICKEKMKFKSVSIVSSLKQKKQYFDEQKNKKQKNEPDQNINNNIRDRPSFNLRSQLKYSKTHTSVFSSIDKQKQNEERKKLGASFIGFSFASNSVRNTSQKVMQNISPKINVENSAIGMNDEFVPVRNDNIKKAIPNFHDRSNHVISPLLQVKKKKRKRGTGNNSEKNKKSELMDFLASLND